MIVREESYTSKASALDFDEIPNYGKKEAHYSFSGKRIKRGLYRTSNGSLLNADVNGALNIARKELGNEWLQNLLRVNGGCMSQPVSVRNLGLTLKEGLRPLETASVRVR